MMSAEIETLHVQANGLRFRADAAGPINGPLVLLLHGFPELARSWKRQIPALADAGYRAVAPDLRGYGGTDKQGPYDLRTLAADVRSLILALRRTRAAVVGHDWGGAVAYGAAMFEPACVSHLIVLNCPPPAAFARELLRNPRQVLRSWYIFFFQIPFLPEWALRRSNAAWVARGIVGGSRIRASWTPEELAVYRNAFLQPGSAEGAIGYYRAAFRGARAIFAASKVHRITAPTLIIWGEQDRFLDRKFVSEDRLNPWFADGNLPTVRKIEAAGHFVQNEAPEAVNDFLLSWLSGHFQSQGARGRL
jgi:pimeloyl-ACP methyl ester carboxylesterase